MKWIAFLVNGQCETAKDPKLPDYYPMFSHEFESEARARSLGPEYTVLSSEDYETYCFSCEVAIKANIEFFPKHPWYLFWR